MGSVIALKKNTENSYVLLKALVEDRLAEVDDVIK